LFVVLLLLDLPERRSLYIPILDSQSRIKMSDLKRTRSDMSFDSANDTPHSSLKRNRSEDTDTTTPKVVNVAAGNRRMFGALLGHLGRAQKNLKEDSDVIKMQISRRQEASQKNTEESKRVAKLQRILSVEQKEKVQITLLIQHLSTINEYVTECTQHSPL
jgi:hypothetical protein